VERGVLSVLLLSIVSERTGEDEGTTGVPPDDK